MAMRLLMDTGLLHRAIRTNLMTTARATLIHLLTEAAEVEHNLLCTYLYAAFSLKRGEATGLDARERDAVARWRGAIVGVAIEEMGHLAMVNNLLMAIGGAAHFDRPNLPVPPGYHPACFVARLTPFDADTLQHFIFLERPTGKELPDGTGFAGCDALPRDVRAPHLCPYTPDYATIGELYGEIREALERFDATHSHPLFVCADGRGQLGPDVANLPGLEVVNDVASAVRTLDAIVEQGEGAPHEREDSHYARFIDIRQEWDALLARNPSFVPAWPAAADPVMRRPFPENAERVWITAQPAAALLDLGNAVYGLALALLAQAYARAMPTPERRACASASIALMHALEAIGSHLPELPARPDLPEIRAGLTFAVPRNLRERDPQTARALFVERLEELIGACDLRRAREALREARAALLA
jgi:hypothetical protein